MLIMNIMQMMNPNGVSSKGDSNSSQNSSDNSFAKRLDDAVAGSATFKDTQNRVNNKKAEDSVDNKKAEDSVKDSELNGTDNLEDSEQEKKEERQYVPYVLIPVQAQTISQTTEVQAQVSEIDGVDAIVTLGTNEELIVNAEVTGNNVEMTIDNKLEIPMIADSNNTALQNNEIIASEEQLKFTILNAESLKLNSDINTDQIENGVVAIPDLVENELATGDIAKNNAEILNFFDKNAKENVEMPDNTFVEQILDEANVKLQSDAVTEGYKALETTRPIIQNGEANQQNGQGKTGSDAQQPKLPETEQTVNTAFAINNNFETKIENLSLSNVEAQTPEAQNVKFQILEQVSSMISEGKQELTLQLKPHHLGGLTITLTQDQNGVTAKLVTASKDAHVLIQSEMAKMQETLRDKGIHVVEMEVIYDQMANTTGKGDSQTGYTPQQGGNAQYRGGNQGGLQMSTEEATWMYEEMTGIEVLAEQGGSVEFSA